MEQMKNQIEMDKKTEIEIDGYKDFVFSNRQNKPFITQTIGRILNRIVDDYNSDIKKFGGTIEPLPHIHPHLLRHTSCSRMAEAGVPIKSVNIGGMAFKTGKTQITKAVSVDESDIAAFKSS